MVVPLGQKKYYLFQPEFCTSTTVGFLIFSKTKYDYFVRHTFLFLLLLGITDILARDIFCLFVL